MNDERVKVASFPDRIAAEISRARLEALGIHAWIAADDAGGAYPQLQSAGVRLLVAAEDERAARQALSQEEPIEELPEGEGEPGAPADPPASPRGRSWLGSVVLVGIGVVLGFLASNADVVPKEDDPYTGVSEHDENGDGRVDAWIEYNADSVSSARYDRNADGKADHWDSYRHDRVARTKLDDNFDGNVDLWFTYDLGVLSSAEQDVDHDGIPDLFTSFRHGVAVSTLLRPKGGLPEREDRYVDGVLREVFEITPAGERRLIRAFDAQGRERPVP